MFDLQKYQAEYKRLPNKMLRKQLLAENPYCYYCKRQVKEYPEIQNKNLPRKVVYPGDMATIEHLYDKFDERRHIIFENGAGRVLACYRCNINRSNRRVRKVPKDLLVERAALAQMRPKGVSRALYFPQINLHED